MKPTPPSNQGAESSEMPPPSESGERRRTAGDMKLGILLAIVIIGFFTSLFFHYQLGAVYNQPYPLNTFLFRPGAQFSDLYDNFTNAKIMLDPATPNRRVTAGIGSFPLLLYTWALYLVFYPNGTHVAWILVTAIFLGTTIYLVRKTIKQSSPDCLWAKSLILTFCSYPVLFCLDRTNTESLLFVMLAAAIFLYRNRSFLWSAILIGVAISMKPYFVVFLPLFFSDRKVKEMFVIVAVAAVVTFGSLCLLPEKMSVLWSAYKASLTGYNEIYQLGNEGMYLGSSLFGLAKVHIYSNPWIINSTDPEVIKAFMQRIMRLYFYFSVVSFSIIGAILCVYKMEFWKKIALILCCMNLLPFVCGDYRLMHFFIPLLLFLQEKDAHWGDRLFAILFALLLIPTSYIHFRFDPVYQINPYEVSDSVIFHPLIMLSLVFGILFSVLRRPELSETTLWAMGHLQRLRPPKTS